MVQLATTRLFRKARRQEASFEHRVPGGNRGQAKSTPTQPPSLEVVPHRKLQLSWARAYSRDLTEVVGAGIACRVGEVRAVEDVIGIDTEVDLLLAPDGKVLGDGCAVCLKTRRPLRGRTGSTECSVSWLTISADAVRSPSPTRRDVRT